MVKATTLAIFLLAVMGCSSSKPAAKPAPAPSETKAAEKIIPSSTPDTSVVSRYCAPGPAPVSLIAMRDSAGIIGGYVFKRLILDSPISYLDPQGSEVAMFHIFGSPEEKKKNAPVIDALRAAFPVETPVECPQGNPPGGP